MLTLPSCLPVSQYLRRMLHTVGTPAHRRASDMTATSHMPSSVTFMDYEHAMLTPPAGADDNSGASASSGARLDEATDNDDPVACAQRTAALHIRSDLSCDNIHLNAGVVTLLQRCLHDVKEEYVYTLWRWGSMGVFSPSLSLLVHPPPATATSLTPGTSVSVSQQKHWGRDFQTATLDLYDRLHGCCASHV